MRFRVRATWEVVFRLKDRLDSLPRQKEDKQQQRKINYAYLDHVNRLNEASGNHTSSAAV